MTTRFSRKGMAIIVALTFSFCLMILIAGMFMTHRNVASQNRLTLQQQQAFFAARAGMQHFLVKSRMMPTELYDAVSYTSGKNPLFAFNEYMQPSNTGAYPTFESANNAAGPVRGKIYNEDIFCLKTRAGGTLLEQDRYGKPRFVYVPIDSARTTFVRLGSYYNPMFRFLSSALSSDASTGIKRLIEANQGALNAIPESTRKRYLMFYLRDCSNTPDITESKYVMHPLLLVRKAASVRPNDWSLGGSSPTYTGFDPANPEQYPYSMEYKVKDISIAAMKELRRYGEEAIKIEVEGSITDFQGKTYKTTLIKTQKITRTGSL